MDRDSKDRVGGPKHIVRTCPECFRAYPEEVRFCGIDGSPLIERSVSAAAGQEEAGSGYVGQLIDGRYRVKQLIGRGGMGSVFEVEHIHMQKRLAMKLLHEDMVGRKQLISRFTREARAVSRLSNDHTVRVYDFGRHKALFFLVMEFLDGEDLEVILSREGALDWPRSLRILDQVCESLAEAHSAGIIHRDLKPENIMILDQGPETDRVKVLDFGLAKITENANDVFTVHSARDLFGTPFYMSPEQIRSEEIDPRADIYSLGCLLYRTLTNRHVFDAPYAFDVLRQHLTARVPAASETARHKQIPARIDRIIWRAMAKRRESRFPDVNTLRREIQAAMRDPHGESALVPSSYGPTAEPVLQIDADLEARLSAFEESHQAAEARMRGDEAEEPPPEIPVGIAVNTGEFPMPDEITRIESSPPRRGAPTLDWSDSTELDRQAPPVHDTVQNLPAVEEIVIHPRSASPPPSRKETQPDPVEDAGPTTVQDMPLKPDTQRDIRLPDSLSKVTKLRRPDLDTGVDELSLIRTSDRLWLGEDDDAYARRLKRGRQWRMLVSGLAACAALVFGTLYWFNQTPATPSNVETEPNNHPANATVLRPGTPITGAIGERLSVFESDRDLFRLDMGGPGRFLELNLSPVASMDLYVDVLDAGGRPITRIDYDGIGRGETIHRLRIPSEEVVLVVSEAKKGDAQPTEAAKETYSLTATITNSLGGGEVEPNDTPPAANAYRAGQRIAGYLDGVKDVDYYTISTDGVMDLRRWELSVEAGGSLVPRISLYRIVGDEPELVFADEGSSATLQTVYEEPNFPNPVYLVAVEHAGRGDRRGPYHMTVDLLPSKPARRSKAASKPPATSTSSPSRSPIPTTARWRSKSTRSSAAASGCRSRTSTRPTAWRSRSGVRPARTRLHNPCSTRAPSVFRATARPTS